ncbi:MAG: flagellar motor switch protein FliM [Acidobacteriaceae bacterium]|nr:flagellar motor switch protein FliM [Acidobacteriaceae bacterium]
MNRQLSQQEIDAVFQKLKGQEQGGGGRKEVPFDFRRPDRIAKSQLRAIHLLHEAFARNLASSLAAYLRAYLTVNLISVEQLSYGEFLEGLPSPSCIVSLSLRPYDGNALIEISPSLVFPILEIILGGKGKSSDNRKREITEIEQHLLDTLFRIILNDLREAWKSVALINFKIETIATEPQMVQILSPTEAVVAIAIEIRIGDAAGTLNVAIPAINIKMIGQKFEQQWMLRKTDPTEAEQDRMMALLRQSAVTLDARLVGPRLTVRDLLDLEVGDCLKFDYRLEKRVDCLVNGTNKFKGQVIDCSNKRSFIVEQLPPPPVRIPKLE